MHKVFGIGLPRTGTTSLSVGLTELGYKTCHCVFSDCLYQMADAFTDTPIYANYGELDMRYPDSKFVYTDRDLKHREEVLFCFQGRENFLHIDVSDYQSWKKLCDFLDKKSEKDCFPIINQKNNLADWHTYSHPNKMPSQRNLPPSPNF